MSAQPTEGTAAVAGDSANAEDGGVVNYNTVAYEYDLRGNLLSKTYSLDGETVDTVSYSYTDSVWKDRLTSFDGVSISYDQIGNPLNWTNGATLTWQHGRQLAGYSKDTTSITYTYNADGIRTSKTVNGTTTQYTVTDGTLRRMTSGDNTLEFINGTSVVFNGVEYWYIFNAQNDVIGIIDENGEYVVEYTYDAWGAPLSKSGSLADTLGTLNPFRYRGYIYDEETGWYYCNSRYYDPGVGRWLTPEPNVYVGGFDTAAGVMAHNVYAYCANNPIKNCDPNGEFLLTAIIVGAVAGAAIGGAVGGTAAYHSANSSGLEGGDLFWATLGGVGKGAVIGGVLGGLGGATVGVIGSSAVSASSIAGTAVITTTINVTARTAEVATLQVKKSINDGDSGWQVVDDTVDAIFSNGGKIISPIGTKAVTTKASHIWTNLTKHPVVPISFAHHLKFSKQNVVFKGWTWANAAYSIRQAVYAIWCDNPSKTATDGGYSLK